MSVSKVTSGQKEARVGVFGLCVFADQLGKGARNNESERICPWALVLFLEWLCDRMCPCLCKKTEDNTYKAILQICSKAQSAVTPFSPGLCTLQADHPLLGKPQEVLFTLITNDLWLQVTVSDSMQSWGKIAYFFLYVKHSKPNLKILGNILCGVNFY